MARNVKIPEPRQKRSKRTRRTIIESAMDVFATYGFDASTTTMIAERAGVSVGSVYAHFKDKYDIFLEGLEAYYAQLLGRIHDNPFRGETLQNRAQIRAALRQTVAETYEAYRQNGDLNREIEKFVMMDGRAYALHEKYQALEEEFLHSLFQQYAGFLSCADVGKCVTLYHLFLGAAFSHMYRTAKVEDVDEWIDTLSEMLTGALVKSNMP
ncbi:MAG: TetR/AcrR family transcriptional regulator [Spirochaetota bacterium]